MTLRLASPARYQIQAVDPVGRSLWGLDVNAERGLWLDHRNKAYCPFEGRFDVSGVALGPFPCSSLPSLLMGRCRPSPPSRRSRRARGREVEFRDERPALEAAVGRRRRRGGLEALGPGAADGLVHAPGQLGLPFGPHARRPGALAEVCRRIWSGNRTRWSAPAGYREASCRDLYPPRPTVPVAPPEGGPG